MATAHIERTHACIKRRQQLANDARDIDINMFDASSGMLRVHDARCTCWNKDRRKNAECQSRLHKSVDGFLCVRLKSILINFLGIRKRTHTDASSSAVA